MNIEDIHEKATQIMLAHKVDFRYIISVKIEFDDMGYNYSIRLFPVIEKRQFQILTSPFENPENAISDFEKKANWTFQPTPPQLNHKNETGI